MRMHIVPAAAMLADSGLGTGIPQRLHTQAKRRARLTPRLAFAAGALLISIGALPNSAVAQLSGKQVRLIVPFPAGGPTDIVARPLARFLGEALHATIVVDNRGGAGGSVGAETVARASADGRTLLMGTVGTSAINPALYKTLPYDPQRDFTPIALVAQAPVAIVVHPSQPVNDVAELVALAKRMPGKLNYGSAGSGTPGHLTGEMFKSAAGIDMQHVPYRGSAPAMTDLLGGQLQVMFDPLQSVLSNVQAGRIRAIAVSSKTRAPVLPNVPTIAESGYSGFETTAWWGLFAPAKLPPALAEALSAGVERVVAGEAFRGNLERLGVIVSPMTGRAFADFQSEELVKWGKAVRDSGATAE
jgi:tripartite-type tricarboxylate transporter receptor subunit TctC